MEKERVTEPLLPVEQPGQYEKERDSVLQELRDGKQGLLGAASAQTGLSYARTRTLLKNKNNNKNTRRNNEGPTWWQRWFPERMQLRRLFASDVQPVAFPVKAGLAALIASLLSFAPGFWSVLSKNSSWAVITVDIVMETSVGLTFSKGLNRTVGTVLAALLAMLVNSLYPFTGRYSPLFLALCTFLGGAIPTFFKFRRPFSDRWNYAVVMSMITFHLLILTPTTQKLKLPLLRLAMIVLGFVIASLVNILLLPNFAGSNVNSLVARNFIRAGDVIEKCAVEYCRGTVLQQHPEVHNHAGSDKLHYVFHEVMSSDSEIDKLLAAATCEPPHGKFFFGYPWHLYRELSENLRFAYYDIVALDSSLRAEIQAPMHLRTMFEAEIVALGKETAEVFRELGAALLRMEKHALHKTLDRADEVALLLQHKVAKESTLLLQLGPSQGSDDEAEHEHGMESSTLPELHPQRVAETPLPPEFEVGRAQFLERQSSIVNHWDCTVKRLAALSLLKFASLLIEIAAKSKHVVGIADELAEKARFEEPDRLGETTKPCDEFVAAFASL